MSHDSSAQFSALQLSDAVLDNLQQLGFQQMTPIQQEALPHALAGRDVVARAKTGSGKTLAFALPMLIKADTNNYAPQALVLCPTRELADQVSKESRKIARWKENLKILTLCGGMPIGPQIGSLEHGAQIIVGTPGRIQDHLRKGTLKLDQVSMLILDEADRMLDMGFKDSIEAILSHIPAKAQHLLFSATFPDDLESLGSNFLREPVQVEVDTQHVKAQISQTAIQIKDDQREAVVTGLLSHYQPESCVVFCNTRQSAEALCDTLRYQGFSALALHGDKDQKDRDLILARFANRSCSVLVATDVASRGLDIDQVEGVINFEMTRDAEVHVHRSGRTGRAGNSGWVYNLYKESEAYKREAAESELGMQMQNDRAEKWIDVPFAPYKAEMITLQFDQGKKNKIRAGDILGALTGTVGLSGQDVGKIAIFDFHAVVAVRFAVSKQALKALEEGKLKGRKVRVRRLG
ncbi:ATP-dependent RNA helicase DbpA [Pokkaliibacter sp. CJK22405]|uniref:ATP-dependent RNA helicase DbpA n=1 Tax=Pokkaliibacter sp. CJK22405 TaxID=3384615 RepID=UPI003984736C